MRTVLDERDFWILSPSMERMLQSVRLDEDDYDEPIPEVANSREIEIAEVRLISELPMSHSGNPRALATFPIPQLCVPAEYLYDYLEVQSWHFVSGRMRAALAQSDDVLQYWPVEIIDSASGAHELDYKLMRVLCGQPVLDLQRSEYDTSVSSRSATGETNLRYHIRRYEPKVDIPEEPAVFIPDEARGLVFVADHAAERVMKAGCSGVSFRDPRTYYQLGRIPQRSRTASGLEFTDTDLEAPVGG